MNQIRHMVLYKCFCSSCGSKIDLCALRGELLSWLRIVVAKWSFRVVRSWWYCAASLRINGGKRFTKICFKCLNLLYYYINSGITPWVRFLTKQYVSVIGNKFYVFAVVFFLFTTVGKIYSLLTVLFIIKFT